MAFKLFSASIKFLVCSWLAITQGTGMKTIEFDTKFGDEVRKVKLVANDHGGGGFQVLIDNFYQGDIFQQDGTWRAHLNARSILTADDINILGELIEKSQQKG